MRYTAMRSKEIDMASSRSERLHGVTVMVVAAGFALASAILPPTVMAHAADGHPARIHAGSCEATGPVADKLTGVGATISLEGTPIPEANVVGAETAMSLDVSETAIADSLDHLTGEPHAIVIYESDEAMDHTIVCGDIGGPVSADGTLAVWLGPTAESGDSGIALLHDAGGSTVSVTIYLAEPSGDAAEDDHHQPGTPDATPGS